MRSRDMILWSLRQIRTRLLESILIILGIGLGIAVVCSVISLVDSFNGNTENYTNSPFYRTLTLRSMDRGYGMELVNKALVQLGPEEREMVELSIDDYYDVKAENFEGTEHIWAASSIREMIQEVEEYPEFENYEDEMNWRRETTLMIVMSTPEVFDVAEFQLIEGDYFRESDLKEDHPVVVIGKKSAEKQFGEESAIGKTVKLLERNFTVIGVVESKVNPEEVPYIEGIGMSEDLDYAFYVPYIFNNRRRSNSDKLIIDEIQLRAAKGVDIAKYYGRVKDYVQSKYGNGISVQGSFIYQQESKKQTNGIQSVIGIFASVVLLIAAVNILNLMLARVLRRYKSIGISTAVGASRFEIFKLFIYEAIILGLFGSFIGIGFAFGILKLLEKILRLELALSLMTIGTGVGIALVVSLIFGLYPASQAAKINPVDALRTD